MAKKILSGEELEYMINTTGALSRLDDETDDEADNEGLTNINVDDAEKSASDDEMEDQLEMEMMYDSDYDKDYIPLFSEEEDEEDEGAEEERKKKKQKPRRKARRTSTPKKKTKIVGPHPGNYPDDTIPSTSAAAAPPASQVATSAAAAPPASAVATSAAAAPDPPVVSGRGRRRRRADVDVPPLVQFDSSTLVSKSGFRWCTRPQATGTRVAARNIVTANPGPNAEAKAADTPEKCFHLFIDDSFLDIIWQWTNKRIEIEAQKYAKKTATHKKLARDELLAFIGVLIFSGCQKDGHMSTCDLWSVDIGAPLYRAAMSQGRFEFILSCLRFDDPQTREARRETDKFAPIRELFDNFMKNCHSHYTPSEYLCVDEQLVGFRGRCPFRIYIPSKPAKYGIKLVLINDCKTKYLLGCIPYVGTDQTRLAAGVGLGHHFTKELTRPYHQSNRNVTKDNWFTSVPLVTDLLEKCGMTLVGTLKANKREVPDKMRTKDDREPGSSAFLFTKDMTLVSYVPPVGTKSNKKQVLLLSTMHTQPNLGDTGKPEIIELYNNTKGGWTHLMRCVPCTLAIEKLRDGPFVSSTGW